MHREWDYEHQPRDKEIHWEWEYEDQKIKRYIESVNMNTIQEILRE